MTNKPPTPLRWWQNLLIAIIGGLTVIAIPAIIKFIYEYNKEDNIKARLWKIQDDIQKMDELINGILSKNQGSLWKGQKEYRHPGTGDLLGMDSWANGKLTMRTFFRSGEHIACDEFKYDKDTIMGKDRLFIDDYNRVFLKDYYLQDGSLTKKHYFPNGKNNYIEYRRSNFQSPLPPPGIIFYR